jgi:hypothetical protein
MKSSQQEHANNFLRVLIDFFSIQKFNTKKLNKNYNIKQGSYHG